MFDDVVAAKKLEYATPKIAVNPSIEVPANFTEYVEQAQDLCEMYTEELQSIMRSFKITTEAVAVSGSLPKAPKYMQKKESEARELLIEKVTKLVPNIEVFLKRNFLMKRSKTPNEKRMHGIMPVIPFVILKIRFSAFLG